MPHLVGSTGRFGTRMTQRIPLAISKRFSKSTETMDGSASALTERSKPDMKRDCDLLVPPLIGDQESVPDPVSEPESEKLSE